MEKHYLLLPLWAQDWGKKRIEQYAKKDGHIDKDDVISIKDWLIWLEHNQPKMMSKIHKITWEQAMSGQKKWHHKMKVAMEKKQSKLTKFKGHPDDFDLISLQDQGHKWVKINTQQGLDFEGDAMGHCVGQGSYDNSVTQGIIEIYSLRDDDNMPHITIEFDVNENRILQIQGKGNSQVAKKYYDNLISLFNTLQPKEVHGNMDKNDIIHKKENSYNIGELLNLEHNSHIISEITVDNSKDITLRMFDKIKDKYSFNSVKFHSQDIIGEEFKNVRSNKFDFEYCTLDNVACQSNLILMRHCFIDNYMGLNCKSLVIDNNKFLYDKNDGNVVIQHPALIDISHMSKIQSLECSSDNIIIEDCPNLKKINNPKKCNISTFELSQIISFPENIGTLNISGSVSNLSRMLLDTKNIDILKVGQLKDKKFQSRVDLKIHEKCEISNGEVEHIYGITLPEDTIINHQNGSYLYVTYDNSSNLIKREDLKAGSVIHGNLNIQNISDDKTIIPDNLKIMGDMIIYYTDWWDYEVNQQKVYDKDFSVIIGNNINCEKDIKLNLEHSGKFIIGENISCDSLYLNGYNGNNLIFPEKIKQMNSLKIEGEHSSNQIFLTVPQEMMCDNMSFTKLHGVHVENTDKNTTLSIKDVPLLLIDGFNIMDQSPSVSEALTKKVSDNGNVTYANQKITIHSNSGNTLLDALDVDYAHEIKI